MTNSVFKNSQILSAVTIILGIGVMQIFAYQLNPQGNPFGTQGDAALGGFLANIITILNAVTFYGGVASVLMIGISLIAGMQWFRWVMGALVGLGLWTVIGAIAWQLGNNQAFNVPGI